VPVGGGQGQQLPGPDALLGSNFQAHSRVWAPAAENCHCQTLSGQGGGMEAGRRSARGLLYLRCCLAHAAGGGSG